MLASLDPVLSVLHMGPAERGYQERGEISTQWKEAQAVQQSGQKPFLSGEVVQQKAVCCGGLQVIHSIE